MLAENCALAVRTRAQRDLRGADVGGLRQDIARRERRRHVLGFVDGVAADLEALPIGKTSSRRVGVIFHARARRRKS